MTAEARDIAIRRNTSLLAVFFAALTSCYNALAESVRDDDANHMASAQIAFLTLMSRGFETLQESLGELHDLVLTEKPLFDVKKSMYEIGAPAIERGETDIISAARRMELLTQSAAIVADFGPLTLPALLNRKEEVDSVKSAMLVLAVRQIAGLLAAKKLNDGQYEVARVNS